MHGPSFIWVRSFARSAQHTEKQFIYVRLKHSPSSMYQTAKCVCDTGGERGFPSEEENCWMRGWTQDGREGTFPASYVRKIEMKPKQMSIDKYGAGGDDDRVMVG